MSSSSSDDKNMKEQQPTVITIKTKKLTRDNQRLSSVSVLGASIMTVSPDGDRIPRKEKKKKISEISITRNKITQDADNLSKKSKVGSRIDGTKIPVEPTPPTYTNKQDYKGGLNDKARDSLTRETSYSPSDTDSCTRNLDEEHKNEEDEDYIDPPSKKKIKLIQNYKKKSGIGYYPKKTLKVIKAFMYDIDNHEKEILSASYKNKKIKLNTNGTN